MTPRQQLVEIHQFILFAWQHFQACLCRQGAAALTYTSLFALVPMITVSYVALSFFPQKFNVQGHVAMFIFSHFLPDTGFKIWDYLQQFSLQARKLTVPGVLMLLITALMMLSTIEQTFNTIWGVKQGRRGASSFLLYWAVLSLGPILIGAGLMFSTYLLSLDLFDGMEQAKAFRTSAQLVPWFFTSAALCLIYCTVPNRRVPFRLALIGAVLAGLAFEVAKYLFALSVKHSSYTLIYGAFAAVPLFLVWIYTGWMIVLAGAVLVYSLENFRVTRDSRLTDLVLCLIILRLFWLRQQQGACVTARDFTQANNTNLPRLSHAQWLRLCTFLQERQLIRATADNELMLARDLHTVTLWDIARLFGAQFSDTRFVSGELDLQPRWLQRMCETLQQTEQQTRSNLSLSLADLFSND